jgi:ribonuclease HII
MKIFYNDIKNTNKIEVGLDEAGRGPLIGRVYAAAVNWGNTDINEKVNDSKKLSSKNRADVLEWIQENVDEWAVGFAEPDFCGAGTGVGGACGGGEKRGGL